ncbi:hypothetical protein KKG45_08995 [bacterium]|nr:hypothetical protein [bacterium]MBU1073371.1 hypothetical protein [bacterium]MBU1676664.1 hypothetical protein [bacterium]
MPMPKNTADTSAIIPGQDVSVIIRAIWKARWWIIILAAAGFVLGLLLAFLLPSVYRAEVTLLPSRDRELNSALLSQLSGFVDINAPRAESLEDLYRQIIRSDKILEPLLDKSWQSSLSDDPVSLYQALGLDLQGSRMDTLRILDKTLRMLSDDVIAFHRDRSSGFMIVSVELAKDPLLAKGLVSEVTTSLDEFLITFHTSHAAEQRAFIGTRLETVALELADAENMLTEFELANRGYLESPQLKQHHGELERHVASKNAVWIELSRQLETARIDEHRRLIRINILDDARLPIRAVRPNKAIFAFFGAVLGLLAGLISSVWACGNTRSQ